LGKEKGRLSNETCNPLGSTITSAQQRFGIWCRERRKDLHRNELVKLEGQGIELDGGDRKKVELKRRKGGSQRTEMTLYWNKIHHAHDGTVRYPGKKCKAVKGG